MPDIILIFFVYAMLGWLIEVSYGAMTRGSFINAGFLNGPWCPIYGIGVIGVTSLLNPVRENLLLLFAGAVVITSLLELITGLLLEKLFHKKWWDYSDRPYNLGGYICPLFSVGWGLACVFIVQLVHPRVLQLIRAIPDTLALLIAVILVMLLIADLIVTVNTIFKLNRKLEHLQELTAMIRQSSDEMGSKVAHGVIHMTDMKEDLEDRLTDMKEDLEDRWEKERTELHERLEKTQALKFEQVLMKMKNREWTQKDEPLEEIRQLRQDLLGSSLPGEHRLIRAFPKLEARHHKESLEELKAFHEQKDQKTKKPDPGARGSGQLKKRGKG